MQHRWNRRLDGAEPAGQQREAGDQDSRDIGEQHDVRIQVDAGRGQRQAQTGGVRDPGAGGERDQHNAVARASDDRLGLRSNASALCTVVSGRRHGLPEAQQRKRPSRQPDGGRPGGEASRSAEHQQYHDRADPPQPRLTHPRMLAGDSNQERQRAPIPSSVRTLNQTVKPRAKRTCRGDRPPRRSSAAASTPPGAGAPGRTFPRPNSSRSARTARQSEISPDASRRRCSANSR